ncbi:MAG: hypothetical protein AAFU60_05535, partial [Bacteroidota bacterium]
MNQIAEINRERRVPNTGTDIYGVFFLIDGSGGEAEGRAQAAGPADPRAPAPRRRRFLCGVFGNDRRRLV